MKKKVLIFTFVFIISLILVSASMTYLSHNIQSEYGPGAVILGYVEMTLADESGSSLFTDGFGNSISLADLLIKNSLTSACDSEGCLPTYSEETPESSKVINLVAGESAVVGFKLTGDIEAISSLTFQLSSTATQSCVNQIEVDFFNDGDLDLINKKAHPTEVCSTKDYGCFDTAETATDYIIDKTAYCQKIELEKSAGYRVGAYITPDLETRIIEMFIHNGTQKVGQICNLPAIPIAGEYFCDINLSNTKNNEYYVCMDSLSGQGYQTKGYLGTDVCGFYGTPPKTETAAYQIFAQSKKFDSVGELKIPTNLNSLTENYIKEIYGLEMNCGAEGCLIPIKITAKTNQTISLSNLIITYSTIGGGLSETKFYDFAEIPATVDLDKKKLNLDKANFTLPTQFGDYTFVLDYRGEVLFSENILIKEVAGISSLYPLTTLAGYPTEFQVSVNSFGKNITKYEWDFGAEVKTTTDNKILHTFNTINTHEVQVTITEEDGLSSSKIFVIDVVSPRDAIKGLIDERLVDLENIQTEIKTYAEFYQSSLNEILDLENTEIQLETIQVSYSENLTDEEYITLMNALFALEIPDEISVTGSADSVPFFYAKDLIDLNFLAEIGRVHDAVDYSSNRDLFLDSIFAWDTENLDVKMTYQELSVRIGLESYVLLSVFEIDINEIETLDYPYFVVFEILEDIKFDSADFQAKDSYYYAEATGSEKIRLATSEEVDFIDLPMFISPEMKRLSVTVPGEVIDTKGISKWLYLILILLLLLVLAFITYVYLQIWYKKKYEFHLFKNRNDLYNMVSYVQREKKKGLNDKLIAEKLKKAGWNAEQVNYVVKKYSGKRTGMFELPFSKFLGNIVHSKEKKKKKYVDLRKRNVRKF